MPETYDAARPHPLIVACHGGSGHGRGFLWSWLKDARSAGAILLSPTSLDATWSLMEPEQDRASLARMMAHVGERWSIDASRILLTGMSDGGTFTYLAGLAGGPFTHLAPMSSAWHPMLMGMADPARIAGLPVYIVHGARDWMFAADMARLANNRLAAACGAPLPIARSPICRTLIRRKRTRGSWTGFSVSRTSRRTSRRHKQQEHRKPQFQLPLVQPVRQLRAIGRNQHGDREDHRKGDPVDEACRKRRQPRLAPAGIDEAEKGRDRDQDAYT